MELRSTFLGTLKIIVAETHFLGDTPCGFRRIDIFGGGSFEGPRIKAEILTGGSDALLRRNNGVMHPDVRLTLKTDDGVYIHVNYLGIRHGPPEVMKRIADGEVVDGSEYYLRNSLQFETAEGKYDWLNRCLAIGVGHRTPEAAIYQVHEIL